MNTRSLIAGLLMPLPLLLGACGRTEGDAATTEQTQAASAPGAAAEAQGGVTLSAAEAKAAGIQIQEVQTSEVASIVVLHGTLGPNQDRIATILPRLPGRILSAPVPLGAAVRAGRTLATIESIALGDVQVTHRQALSESKVAEAALERAQRLAADDIIARKDLERARGNAEIARAALRAAADKLRLLGVSPAALNHTNEAVYPVTTPLAGTVIDKHAVVGAQVEAAALFTVADLSTVWLEADVFERDLAALTIGSPASVTTAAYPDQVFEGRLTYLAATMDTTSRTVKARIEVGNASGRLKPGMYATVRITSSAKVSALVLPAQALTLMQDKPTVFIATPRGFEPRTVETASRSDGSVEIRQGLAPGEKVAVSGAYALKSRILKSSLAKDD